MVTLEDILESYGAAADFWATASNADRDPGQDESWDCEALLEAYRDPQDLCGLGCLLLKRYGVDQLPLCEEDFKGFTYFDNKDMLLIGPHSYEFNVPEFPDKVQTLTMAVRAFGLAWLYYEARYDEGIKVSEGWREVLALDGLRVAFLEADNRDAVDKVCQHFFSTWLEDWEDRLADYGLVEPFVANFRETAAYLRGTRKAVPEVSNVAPNVGRELLKSQRLIEWQLKEILTEIRNRELTTEEVNSLSTAIAQELEKAPSYVLEPYEDRLAKELGEGWLQLPIEVQRLLIQAELLRSILHKIVDADWAPVALHYIRATETLLRRLGDKLDTQKLPKKLNLNNGYPLRRANIEAFRTAFQRPQFAQLAGAHGVSDAPLMAELGPELDIVIRNYRNPAMHGAEPMSALKVRGS